MSKRWNLAEKGLGMIASGVGLVFFGILGLWVYMSATATPLHPSLQDVPSVVHVNPGPEWAGAVEQGRQIVRASLGERNLAGLSVAVSVGGDIVWAEGFGWADVDEREPVTPATQFRMGTASTALTSAAAGLLIEQGRLDLDDEIQTYVPGFPRKEWPVTLRQLMGHLAGVRNDGGDEGPLLSARCERPADALQAFADRPLLFEPGTRFRYSSYGWILVSAAIESAADEPFLVFMRKQVFEPLGMDSTTADSTTESIPDRATFYFPRFAADTRYGLDPMREVDYSCYAGSSIFLSTPSDLVRFAVALDSGALLQPATVTRLQAPQHLASGEETGYGLGWDLETVTVAGKPARLVVHDGESLGGRVASLLMLPEHGIVLAVMSNTSYADTSGVALKIAEVFGGRGRHSTSR